MNLAAISTLWAGGGLTRGDEVTVDGFPGRGMVVAQQGRRLTVKFRNGEYVSRDQKYVHSFNDNTYVSRYRSSQ